MSIFTTLKNDKASIKSLALGKFDGLHIAHFELIKRLKDGALAIIDNGSSCLTPFREKFLKIPCFYYNFSDIKALDGKGFIELLKSDFVNLEKIVVGYDFKFGKDRAWSAYDLPFVFDGKSEIVDKIKVDEIPIHSKIIRNFITNGECEKASNFLGRFYEIIGKVVSGQGLGGKIFRTLNLEFERYLIPKFGVYATWTWIDGIPYKSITFIGNRLSTDLKFSLETHILDKEIYVKNGTLVCVEFCKFIRENQKFDSLEALKMQIVTDIKNVRKIL